MIDTHMFAQQITAHLVSNGKNYCRTITIGEIVELCSWDGLSPEELATVSNKVFNDLYDYVRGV